MYLSQYNYFLSQGTEQKSISVYTQMNAYTFTNCVCACMCVCLHLYVCVFVQEVEATLIDSKNGGSVEGGGAAAVDVEERRAEHGERTDQPCTHTQNYKRCGHT